jgi:thioredoxin-like negative regulator of GroEL
MIKVRSATPFLFVIAAAVLVMPTVLNLIKGPAKTPGVFDDQYTLYQATALSQETGKPMLVLATADWCPPCQKLKRTTLMDPVVVDWINEHTIPVYLEDGASPDEIASLGVRSYPTTMLIQDGQILASLGGPVGSGQFIKVLGAELPALGGIVSETQP